jgi:hypothetical protein
MRLDNWLRGAMLPLCMAPAKGRVVACCCKADMALETLSLDHLLARNTG